MSALAAARRALALFPDATELCGAVHNLASAELCLEEAGANPEPRAAMRMYGMSSAYVSVAEALMGHDEKALRANEAEPARRRNRHRRRKKPFFNRIQKPFRLERLFFCTSFSPKLLLYLVYVY